MSTICLHFDSKQAFQEVLADLNLELGWQFPLEPPADEPWVFGNADAGFDVIGELYDPGKMQEDGTVSPMTMFPGWHVNFIGTLPQRLEPFVVTPRRPRRVFFEAAP
jgi:hypothetical protein